MAKNRVLVVDDEPDVLMLTCTALEDAGFDVIRAKDVPQAKKLLLSEIPDVIVTDLMMPDESGYSLIKYVREKSGVKNTPIVVTSVLDTEAEIFQQGADAYLPKPFTPEELIKMVTDLVNREEIPRLIEKARELVKEKNYTEAQQVLNQILKDGVDETYLAFASFYLGEISRQSNKREEAENYYKQAIQNSTQFWRAYNELGNIYHARSDIRRALAYWEKSLLINPDQKELKDTVNRLQKEIIT
ncbi:MAG TPA: response regulator [Acidobacteriota bacterium]|nr:response regulator [Acidobacteriota bacterium]